MSGLVDPNALMLCCLDHGDHTHIRFNRTDSSHSEWYQVSANIDALKEALPPNTRVHW